MSKHRQLSLIWSVLWCCPAGVANNSDYVSSPYDLVLCLEWYVSLGFLCLAHYLYLDTAGLDVVEDKFGARGSFDIDTTSNSDLLLLVILSGRKVVVVCYKLPKVRVGLELVWVWIRVFGLS